jgi:hypothetical protein
MVSQELELFEQSECRRVQVQYLIDTGWSAQENTTHETLRPRQIVALHRRVLLDVIRELQARRRA